MAMLQSFVGFMRQFLRRSALSVTYVNGKSCWRIEASDPEQAAAILIDLF